MKHYWAFLYLAYGVGLKVRVCNMGEWQRSCCRGVGEISFLSFVVGKSSEGREK